jgi:hypothetical protein
LRKTQRALRFNRKSGGGAAGPLWSNGNLGRIGSHLKTKKTLN